MAMAREADLNPIVKNKALAEIQITAEEQLLREAEIPPPSDSVELDDLIWRERWSKFYWVKDANWEESEKDFVRSRNVWEPVEIREAEIPLPTDSVQLEDYRLRKRNEYEDLIRRKPWNKMVWITYAEWEESQKDFVRSRNVWERALQVDDRCLSFWFSYARFEMKNKFIDNARNVWTRATELLPRVDLLWSQYIQMEEMLRNVAAARQIFRNWMEHKPDEQVWLSYIEFELAYNEVERARDVFEQFVECHPKVRPWIRFAQFEMKNGEIERARNCYKRAVDKLLGDDDEVAYELLMAFAKFEEKCKETETARIMYDYVEWRRQRRSKGSLLPSFQPPFRPFG